MKILTPLLFMLMAGVVILPFASKAEETSDKGLELMKSEYLGGLKLDMPSAAVEKLIGKPGKTGKDTMWEAIGMYVQDWSWPKQGLSLQMSSDDKGGPKIVMGISAEAPCKLTTLKGMHIGSTEAEVRKAYGEYEDKEMSQKGETFVAVSIYGGVIFSFEKGKVVKIFIGALAE